MGYMPTRTDNISTEAVTIRGAWRRGTSCHAREIPKTTGTRDRKISALLAAAAVASRICVRVENTNSSSFGGAYRNSGSGPSIRGLVRAAFSRLEP